MAAGNVMTQSSYNVVAIVVLYCYLLYNNVLTTAKTQILSISEYCQLNENKITIHG